MEALDNLKEANDFDLIRQIHKDATVIDISSRNR